MKSYISKVRKSIQGSSKLSLFALSIAIIMLITSIYLFLQMGGIITIEPKVSIKPDNCYNKVLKVVTDYDYKPLSYRDTQGQMAGREIELIIEIANRLHYNLDIKMMSWQDSLNAIRLGEADLVMTCEANSKINKDYNIMNSIPTFKDDFVFFGKKSSNHTTISNVYTKKIAVVEDSNAIDAITTYNLNAECMAFQTSTEAIKAVIDNKCNYIVGRYSVMMAIIESLQLTNQLVPLVDFGQSLVAFGVNTSNMKLKTEIDNTLKDLLLDGTLDSINAKWMPFECFTCKWTKDLYYCNPVICLILALLIFYIYYQDSKHFKVKAELDNTLSVLFEDYEAVIVVDPETSEYQNYGNSGRYKHVVTTANSGKPDFFKTAVNDVKKLVHTDDQSKFSDLLDKESMLKKLEKEPYVSCDYRLLTDNIYTWHRAKCKLALDSKMEEKIIIGIFNAETEYKDRSAYEALTESFVSIFKYNIENDRLTVIKDDIYKSDEEIQKEMTYEGMMSKLSLKVEEAYWKEFMKLCHRDYLNKYLAETDRREFVFRMADGSSNPWRACFIIALERKEGAVTTAVIAFMTVDSLLGEKLEKNFRD